MVVTMKLLLDIDVYAVSEVAAVLRRLANELRVSVGAIWKISTWICTTRAARTRDDARTTREYAHAESMGHPCAGSDDSSSNHTGVKSMRAAALAHILLASADRWDST
jgi:hypothetical protein